MRPAQRKDDTLDYPDTRVEPVTKTVGGITFDDPYAWLQEDSEEALNWQWQQDEIATACARGIPGFDALTRRIRAQGDLLAHALGGAPRKLGGKWFRMTVDESGVQALRVSDSVEQPGRPIVDAKDLAEAAGDGRTRFITWWEPSPNAAYVAFAVIAGGDMTGTWRVVDARSGKLLAIEVPALAYTGATPGWLPDETGFYVNDRTDDGRHRLHFVAIADGAKQQPAVVFGDDEVPRNVAGLTPQVSPGGRYAVAVAQPHEHIAYRLGDLETGEWRAFLPEGYHAECDGVWLDDETYVARVHGESPRGRVVAIDVTTSNDPSTWREIVPASDAVLRGVTIVDGRVAVCEIKDVSVRFRLVHLDGTPDRILPLDGPGNSRIAFILRRFDISEALTFDYETFSRPPAYYHYDVGAGRLEPLGMPPSAIDGLEVSQRFARSADGTQVPYFLVHGKGVNIAQPQKTLVTGYGGFNVALLPAYLRHIRFFIEAGGVYVVANLRGGAEYGKDWHDAGRLHKKQNTFDDLFAVAEDLISAGITKPEMMAMQGASNGGLLAGVAIVQRPDLWRAVVPVVPIFDQLEPYPPGPEYNAIRAIWYEDYGDPEEPEDARVMFGYSPYHNVRDGVRYPAVYQVFGEKDLGCRPFHGRKFTARLQAADTSGRPILLRVWKDVGHGSADPEKGPPQTAEWLAFVMHELGMDLPGDDD